MSTGTSRFWAFPKVNSSTIPILLHPFPLPPLQRRSLLQILQVQLEKVRKANGRRKRKLKKARLGKKGGPRRQEEEEEEDKSRLKRRNQNPPTQSCSRPWDFGTERTVATSGPASCTAR